MTMTANKVGRLSAIFFLSCLLVAYSRAFFLGPLQTCIRTRATFSGDHRRGLQCRVLPPLAASRDAAQQAAIASRDDRSGDRDKQTWTAAEIVDCRPACPSGKSTLVEVRVDRATRRGYTTPGQFVQLRPDDDITAPIFLAMSSAPTSGDADGATLQFLVKMSPRLPWLQDTLVPGEIVKVSPVMGAGFPLARLPSAAGTVVLAAAGSGVAPLKACIESGRLGPGRPADGRIVLYYGEWTEDDLCFTELYAGWREEYGVDVRRALSRAPDARGYVQDVWSDEGLVRDAAAAKSTWAILCGMDDMVDSCTRVLKEAGVDEDRILLNL